MLIVTHGCYSLTYLLISRRYRVPTQSVVIKSLTLSLRVVALTPSLWLIVIWFCDCIETACVAQRCVHSSWMTLSRALRDHTRSRKLLIPTGFQYAKWTFLILIRPRSGSIVLQTDTDIAKYCQEQFDSKLLSELIVQRTEFPCGYTSLQQAINSYHTTNLYTVSVVLISWIFRGH